MNQLNVGDLVQVRIAAERFPVDRKDNSAISHVAFIKDLRKDKLVLMLAQTDEATSMCAGVTVLLQKPMKRGVLTYKCMVTFIRREHPPSVVLRLLARGEQVERRAFDRVLSSADIQYSRADGTFKGLPAKLRNLSATGACLIISEEATSGNELFLELPFAQDILSVKAVVRWADKSQGNDTIIGVEFSSVTRLKGFSQTT